jgi:hypothetical protein
MIDVLDETEIVVNHDIGQKQLEVIVAELETKLRGTILRVIRPTLDQTQDLHSKVGQLAEQIGRHENVIGHTEHLREEIRSQKELTMVLTDQFNASNEQTREFMSQAMSRIRDLHTQAQAAEARVEDTQAELRKQNRDISRVREEQERVQVALDADAEKIWAGINANSKKGEKMAEEVAQMIRELQKQREELLDDLYGENKGLSQIRHDLVQVDKMIAPLPELERELQNSCVQLEALKAHSTKAMDHCMHTMEDLKGFKGKVDVDMEAMREDFRNQSNKLVAHNTARMRSIRNDYQAELDATRTLRYEIASFQGESDKKSDALQEVVEISSRRIDALHRELRQDIEEIQAKRLKDRDDIDTGISALRQGQDKGRATTGMLRGSLDYVGRLVGLVIEGERLSSAMFVQDFADRSGERWLGLPGDLGRQTQKCTTAEDFQYEPAKPGRGGGGGAGRSGGSFLEEKLVTLDWRKGLSQDTYRPGQVAYQGSQFDRRDLLLLHHKLLQKAARAYERGPQLQASARWPVGGATSVTLQPGANGGATASSARLSKGMSTVPTTLPDDLWAHQTLESAEDSPWNTGIQRQNSNKESSHGSEKNASKPCSANRPERRQRPGSQGQPQAIGSRGTMMGSLGETEPGDKEAMIAGLLPAASDVGGSHPQSADPMESVPEKTTPEKLQVKLPGLPTGGRSGSLTAR